MEGRFCAGVIGKGSACACLRVDIGTIIGEGGVDKGWRAGG